MVRAPLPARFILFAAEAPPSTIESVVAAPAFCNGPELGVVGSGVRFLDGGREDLTGLASTREDGRFIISTERSRLGGRL